MESKDIHGYKVTRDGRIFSYKGSEVREMSQSYVRKYKTVSLTIEGKTLNKYVHRLVAECFCEKREGCNEVDHVDGNKLNNHADNLEWVTRSENMKRAYDSGLIDNRGSNSALSKTTEEDVLEMRRLWDEGGTKQRELAEMFGVARSQVSAIVNRKQWGHI